MSKYDVHAVVEGDSVNEVASKLMTGAYLVDFELEELEVAKQTGSEVIMLTEDVNNALARISAPEDNDPQDTFNFPHVKTLVNGLTDRKRRASAD